MIINISPKSLRQPRPRSWLGFSRGGLDYGTITVKLPQHLHAHKDRSLGFLRNACYKNHTNHLTGVAIYLAASKSH